VGGWRAGGTKEALRHAFVDRVQAGDGYFDIQTIQIMLVYSVNEKAGANQITGLFIFGTVCSLEYAHAMNIPHDELTWPAGLQQKVQEDHRANSRVAQRGDGGIPRPLQIWAIMLGRLEKLHDTRCMTPSGTHRDGRPFGISLESLAAQGVSLEMGVFRAVTKKQQKQDPQSNKCYKNIKYVEVLSLFSLTHPPHPPLICRHMTHKGTVSPESQPEVSSHV